MASVLTIGRLARRAGVNVETVRYYQRIGLVDEPGKPAEGFRTYAPEAVDRITFIKRAQALGFSLDEVRELLEIGDGHCADVCARAEEKRQRMYKLREERRKAWEKKKEERKKKQEELKKKKEELKKKKEESIRKWREAREAKKQEG